MLKDGHPMTPIYSQYVYINIYIYIRICMYIYIYIFITYIYKMDTHTFMTYIYIFPLLQLILVPNDSLIQIFQTFLDGP